MNPRPLFADASFASAPSKTVTGAQRPKARGEPGPLSFPADKAAEPVASPKSQPIPKGPGALQFPETPRVKAPPPQAAPATALFATAQHGAVGSALAAARKLNPQLAPVAEEQLSRYLNQLFPLTLERVQAFAAVPLQRSQECVAQATELTTAFSRLRAAEVIEQAVEAARPKTGMLQVLKAKLTRSDDLKADIRLVERELAQLSKAVQELQPKCAEVMLRLSLALTALRAAEQISSSDGGVVLDSLNHRLDLLRATTTHAGLVHEQLRQLLSSIVALQAKCAQVLAVTLSATQLASPGN